MVNTTTARDAPNDSDQAGLFGLYQPSRPICTNTGNLLQAVVLGDLTLQSPAAGSYCVLWLGSDQNVSDGGIAYGRSESSDLIAVQSGGDASEGYPSNDATIHMDQSALAVSVSDLEQEPNYWAFGITEQDTSQQECSMTVGFLATTTYTLIAAQSEPGNQNVSLTSSR
jgi:hypothetical protein